MNIRLSLLFLVVTMTFYACQQERAKKILVFTETQGYHHASISDGVNALFKLGKENGILVDTSSTSSPFTDENLRQYSAIVFLSTTGDVFDYDEQNAFERYIQAGGGFVGIHAATDTEYHWPWFNKLVGGYFANHPAVQEATLDVVDTTHPSTAHLEDKWIRTDEWYNFKSLNEETNKLLNIDETSYEGGSLGKDHPMAWYHDFDGGQAWYTALGHTSKSFEEEAFLQHLLGGIQYAMGDNTLDYAKVKTAIRPEENRLTVDRLVEGVFVEPTEMTILPNYDVLIAQRRGELMRYYQETEQIKKVGFIDVYHTSEVEGVNAEEGFMGLCKDPNFSENGWVYIFYAVADEPVNRLSRFFIDDDSLHMDSEVVILDLGSDRDICCHTGGSIAFSGDGQYLFLSTGDNATPFDEKGEKYVNDGYAPQDNRPGHEPYDARRSSANTNDLRGKILRIKVAKDGSYSIPEGNLFPPNTPKTRPEIYVMGNRNPYRISIDPKTDDLYWGEVGPDANRDLDERGPMGYDEVNRATQAGNFGWPLFVANNKAYNAYNYTTGFSGPRHNADKPINNSKNNTGLTELPPAQPAYIYYPYKESEVFPELASGGRNAMAGPVYHSDLFPEETRMSDYYDGKLFIYDWIRQWIKVVTIGDTPTIEPFLPSVEFANIIDMEVAPNGQLYLLEYGKGWFSKNPDAGLSRIVYNAGNRAPRIDTFYVDKLSGSAPHTFTAHVEAEDPEGDKLTYQWHVGPNKEETTEPSFKYTIEDIGDLALAVTVVDQHGNEAYHKAIIINSGNQNPTIDITVDGNQHMYFDKEPINYRVNIIDDQELVDANIMIKKEMGSGDVKQLGHLSSASSSVGEALIAASDCQSCHKVDTMSIGPSYVEVARHYKDVEYAGAYLAEKIRIGGSGNWGEGAMAAHPSISVNESMMIADWILSLEKDESANITSLPLQGIITPKYDAKRDWEPNIYLRANYTDAPTNGAKPLTANTTLSLKPNLINANYVLNYNGVETANFKGVKSVLLDPQGQDIYLKDVDLDLVKSVSFHLNAEHRDGFTIKLTTPDRSTTFLEKTYATFTRKFTVPISGVEAGLKEYRMIITSNNKEIEDPIYFDRMVFNK